MSTILVIEDEPTLRSGIIELLSITGYEAIGSPNGQDGVEMARQHHPDLIVCDIMMPQLDGYGVLEALQSDPDTANIPFIFLTALGERDEQRHGMRLGADDYLTKPFLHDELLDAIEARLQKEQVRTEIHQQQHDELRRSIVYSMPHELRTPLTNILGYADLLVSDAADLPRDQITEMARAVLVSGRRLQRQIENYLLYAQLEVIRLEPGDVLALQNAITPSLERLLVPICRQMAQDRDRAADLKLELPDAALVLASENLKKIVEELLDNALKFSSPGSPVTVRGMVGTGTYELLVCDQGRGMSAEDIRRVGAYLQFKRALHEQQGSGLGLTIARRLAELCQGSLQLDSMPGQGTCARVTLPLAPNI